MKARLLRSVAVAGSLGLIVMSGCSDDVVCPELPDVPRAYVSADLVESATQSPATSIRVAATADVVPSLLAAFINDTRLTHVQFDGLGQVATLDSDEVIWQPGQQCTLKVTVDDNFAVAPLTLPGPTIVQAPSTVAPGETLVISWSSVAAADYYRISGDIDAVTTDTEFAYPVDAEFLQDVISGTVNAVAGPFPGAGSPGNVIGGAWGYFTASYADSGSKFSVEVSAPLYSPSSRILEPK
jgi:hypothetical protein